MDSFFKSIGSTLEVVGKVLIPQTPSNKDDKEKKETIQPSQLAIAGLGLNNNLKPKGAAASAASTGMF